MKNKGLLYFCIVVFNIFLFNILFPISYDDSDIVLSVPKDVKNNDVILLNLDNDDIYSLAKSEVLKNKKIVNDVYFCTNEYRNELSLNSLVYDDDLSYAATIRAIEIAVNDKFEHVRPNGLSYSSILKELNISSTSNGENIAFGYNSSSDVCLAWKNSNDHYFNIVYEKYNRIGIGFFKYNGISYWVQIFSN